MPNFTILIPFSSPDPFPISLIRAPWCRHKSESLCSDRLDVPCESYRIAATNQITCIIVTDTRYHPVTNKFQYSRVHLGGHLVEPLSLGLSSAVSAGTSSWCPDRSVTVSPPAPCPWSQCLRLWRHCGPCRTAISEGSRRAAFCYCY